MPVQSDEIIKLLSVGEGTKPSPQDGRFRGLVALSQEMGRAAPERDAPVREVMARLGDNWSALILKILATGSYRHATLKRVVAAFSAEGSISQRMLTLRLKALERDGFVARTVQTNCNPPRVYYMLTPLGHVLEAELSRLLVWIAHSEDQIQEARKRFTEDGREQ